MKELFFLEKYYKSLTFLIYQLEKQTLQGNIEPLQVARQYKFYTALLFRLFQIRKNQGGDITSAIVALKHMANKDFTLQKEINSIFWGGTIQMLLISIVLNFFFFYLAKQFEPRLSSINFSLIGIHCCALGGFVGIYYVIYNIYFSSFSLLFSVILTIRIYGLSEINCSSLLSHSAISKKIIGKSIQKQNSFSLLLSEMLRQIKEQGRPLNSLMEQVIDELSFRYRAKMYKFLKTIDVIKFLLLAMFFLGSYLYYLQKIFVNMQTMSF